MSVVETQGGDGNPGMLDDADATEAMQANLTLYLEQLRQMEQLVLARQRQQHEAQPVYLPPVTEHPNVSRPVPVRPAGGTQRAAILSKVGKWK